MPAGPTDEVSDAAEAAAFAARLRARDAASHKKVGAAAARQQQLEREAEEAAAAAAAAAEPVKELRTVEDVLLEAKKRPNEKLKDNEAYMQRLREEARRAYLKKREGDQVLLQERKVQDREWLYSQVGDKLTAEERRALELRKETLQLAKTAIQERQGREEIEGYIMPEAYDEDLQARLRVMHQPYQEPKQQLSEQQLLEKQKTQAALARFGAKEGREQAPAYKLVDEAGAAIEFEAREMHGSLTPETDASAQKPAQAPEAAQKAKGQSLQVCCRGLLLVSSPVASLLSSCLFCLSLSPSRCLSLSSPRRVPGFGLFLGVRYSVGRCRHPFPVSHAAAMRIAS